MKMLNKIIGSSIAIAAVLAFSASTTQAQNLLVNPDFDLSGAGNWTANPITLATVDQGWATFGNSGQNDMSSSPDSPQSGTYALLQVNAAGNNWNPAGAYQIVSGITVGQTYTFSAYMLTDTGITWAPTGAPDLPPFGPLNLQLSFQDAALTTVGTGYGGWHFVPGSDTWSLGSVTATAPAGAVNAIVYVMFMDFAQTTAENAYFDNTSLIAVPEPSSLALLSMGLAVPFYFIRRRKS